MPRDYEVSLEDICEAIGWIEQFVAGMTLDFYQELAKAPVDPLAKL